MVKYAETHHFSSGKLISLGIFVFIIGLLRYYNVDWSVVLMVAGVLILLKGFYVKSRE